MKKWMKKQRQAENAPAAAPLGQAKTPDVVMAFVAKGPAQQVYNDFLASVFGSIAKHAGHFTIPERGETPYLTGYAFQGFQDEAAAIEAKLAASPIATHFEPELIECSADEQRQAEQSTASGTLPVLTVSE